MDQRRPLLALAQPYRVGREARTIGCSILRRDIRKMLGAAGLFKIANMGVRTAKLAGAAATGTARLVQTLGP